MRSMMAVMLLWVPTMAWAVPGSVATQGFVRTASGDPLEGANDITVSLYDDAAGTNPAVYTVTIPDYPFVDGTYTVELVGLTQQMLSITDLYVGVAIEGGSDLLPRTQLHSVPFARRAEIADHLADAGCADGEVLLWNDAASQWACAIPAGAETDPAFAASDAAGITSTDIASWDAAAGYGDHAGLYIDATAPAAAISNTDIASWDAAAGYGDHAGLYIDTTAPAAAISNTDIASWDAAAGYGDHAGLYFPATGGAVTGTTIDILPTADGQDATLSFSGGDGDGADWAWVSSGEDLRLLEPEENSEVVILIDDDDKIVFSPNGVETMTMWETGIVTTPSLVEQSCPTGMQYFGGYCVENLAGGTLNAATGWTTASNTCASRGMMICPIRALASCDVVNTTGSCHYATDAHALPVWTSDFEVGSNIFGRIVTYNSSGNLSATASQSESYEYLCCTQAYVR